MSKNNELVPQSHFCKCCSAPLAIHQSYCPHCGAKRIENRLTAGNLLEDFNERFLNLENGFMRTFLALFKNPKDVIGGYINGTRKKYLSAISYFAISITVAGAYTFIFNEFFIDDIVDFSQSLNPNNTPQETEWGLNFAEGVQKYQSLITFLTIPVLALISKLVFIRNRTFNYIEHLVIWLYTYSHYNIVNIGLSLLVIWSPLATMLLSGLVTLLAIPYTTFVFQQLYSISLEKAILQTLLALLLSGIVLMIIIVVAGGIFYYSGLLDELLEMSNKSQAMTSNFIQQLPCYAL
ncbi:DUF3667 domain-containing protein [Croceiramulus getboli]|nr:DUF3667 domain-containing protein [Flavobacteriaceae bacterium YJPT1-3]